MSHVWKWPLGNASLEGQVFQQVKKKMLCNLKEPFAKHFAVSVKEKKKLSIKRKKGVGLFVPIKKSCCRAAVWYCAGLERKSGFSNQAVIQVCNLTGTLVFLLRVWIHFSTFCVVLSDKT